MLKTIPDGLKVLSLNEKPEDMRVRRNMQKKCRSAMLSEFSNHIKATISWPEVALMIMTIVVLLTNLILSAIATKSKTEGDVANYALIAWDASSLVTMGIMLVVFFVQWRKHNVGTQKMIDCKVGINFFIEIAMVVDLCLTGFSYNFFAFVLVDSQLHMVISRMVLCCCVLVFVFVLRVAWLIIHRIWLHPLFPQIIILLICNMMAVAVLIAFLFGSPDFIVKVVIAPLLISQSWACSLLFVVSHWYTINKCCYFFAYNFTDKIDQSIAMQIDENMIKSGSFTKSMYGLQANRGFAFAVFIWSSLCIGSPLCALLFPLLSSEIKVFGIVCLVLFFVFNLIANHKLILYVLVMHLAAWSILLFIFLVGGMVMTLVSVGLSIFAAAIGFVVLIITCMVLAKCSSTPRHRRTVTTDEYY